MSLKNLKLLISTSGVLAAVCFIGFTVSFFSSSDKELFRSGLLLFACGLFCLLIFALFYLYARRTEGSRLDADERLRRLQEVADLRMSVIESLAIAIDAKDQTTQGHVRRTRVYAAELGRLLGVSTEETEALKAGALLPHIGKLAVPDYILNKPGRPTPAEFEKMKVQPVVRRATL